MTSSASKTYAALLVPKGDYAKEKAILDQLETYDEIDYRHGPGEHRGERRLYAHRRAQAKAILRAYRHGL